jgi:triphosphoribosyl-dephospho-CoA synthetase
MRLSQRYARMEPRRSAAASVQAPRAADLRAASESAQPLAQPLPSDRQEIEVLPLVSRPPVTAAPPQTRSTGWDLGRESIRIRPAALARNLAHGAMLELRLTPKPGLVDLHDSGSHPDLTCVRVARSASLLPAYFRELLEARRSRGLPACVAAGRRAEERMYASIGTNAHRGFIFLSGLVLLASYGETEGTGELRLRIARLAEEFFHTVPAGSKEGETHGARARREHSVGGVRAEALAGLPSVFEVALPALASHFEANGDFVLASHYMMSCLMQTVEDTTTLRRGRTEGLARIRHDGALLQRVIEEEGDHVALLERWNEEYSAAGLTMGGVADCMGVAYGLYLTLAAVREQACGELHTLLLRTWQRRASAR